MTKDLRLPCESGIRRTLREMLITAAHTEYYLCEQYYWNTSSTEDSSMFRNNNIVNLFVFSFSMGQHLIGK